MSALSPTTALPMAPPSTQSLFARSWRYLDQGDVYRLLRGHYSPVLALTDSFADPTRSPLLRPKPRSRSLCRLRPAPAAGGTIPTLSLRILPCLPGPLSRRSRGVHLPVSSSTPSAYPRTLSRSASRVNPSKRFHDGSPFRDCSHFVMFRPSGLLASPIVPTAAAYRRRAAEAFTSELNMLRCLRMHRICLPPAQAIGGVGTYTPLDSQPCRLLQCNGERPPNATLECRKSGRRCRVESGLAHYEKARASSSSLALDPSQCCVSNCAQIPKALDGAGVQGGAIPLAGAIHSATKLALARSLPSTADQPARSGRGPRPTGSRDGSPLANRLSSCRKPAFGQPSAAGAGCAVQLFALPGSGRDQLASGTGHSTHGGNAQGVGRESHPGRSENAKYLGQHPANLSATASAQYPGFPTVAMLPSVQDPRSDSSNALNNYVSFKNCSLVSINYPAVVCAWTESPEWMTPPCEREPPYTTDDQQCATYRSSWRWMEHGSASHSARGGSEAMTPRKPKSRASGFSTMVGRVLSDDGKVGWAGVEFAAELCDKQMGTRTPVLCSGKALG